METTPELRRRFRSAFETYLIESARMQELRGVSFDASDLGEAERITEQGRLLASAAHEYQITRLKYADRLLLRHRAATNQG